MKWDCEIGSGRWAGPWSPSKRLLNLLGSSPAGRGVQPAGDLGDEGETWEWTIRFVPVD